MRSSLVYFKRIPSMHAFSRAVGLVFTATAMTLPAAAQSPGSPLAFDTTGVADTSMFAPITLGQDLSKGCFMAMTVHDGAWHRLAPEGGGYLC